VSRSYIVLLNAIVLSVIRLSVVRLSVVAPFLDLEWLKRKTFFSVREIICDIQHKRHSA